MIEKIKGRHKGKYLNTKETAEYLGIPEALLVQIQIYSGEDPMTQIYTDPVIAQAPQYTLVNTEGNKRLYKESVKSGRMYHRGYLDTFYGFWLFREYSKNPNITFEKYLINQLFDSLDNDLEENFQRFLDIQGVDLGDYIHTVEDLIKSKDKKYAENYKD